MIIGIDKGHATSGKGTGASNLLVETIENRKIGNRLIELLRECGHTVIDCSVDQANSQDEQLSGIVKKANAQHLDQFVSLHLNAGGGRGTETYVYPNCNKAVATRVNDKVANSCAFRNRGVKEAKFYVLKNTKASAILVEVCFVDSQEDKDKLNVENVAIALYEGITNSTYVKPTPPPPPVTPPTTGNLIRVFADGKQVGAYSVLDNAINEAKTKLQEGIKEIKITQ